MAQKDRGRDGQGWLSASLLVSGAYGAVFLLTFELLFALDDPLTDALQNFTSLIFLPHGVRVLAAWLYGWRAVPYLLPGATIGHLYLYGPVFDTGLALGWAVGLACAPLAFTLLALCGADLRRTRQKRTHWRDLVLVGGVASIFNTLLTGLAYGNALPTLSARFIGDMLGTLACMWLLMAVLRLRDRLRWR